MDRPQQLIYEKDLPSTQRRADVNIQQLWNKINELEKHSKIGTNVTISGGGSSHLPVTVTDTSSIDLTITSAQKLSGVVLPQGINRKITIVSSYPYTVLSTDDVVICE
jgi:hypothetical protein